MWKKRTCFLPSSLEICLKEMGRARPGKNLSNRFTRHPPFGEDAEGMSSEKEVGGRENENCTSVTTGPWIGLQAKVDKYAQLPSLKAL